VFYFIIYMYMSIRLSPVMFVSELWYRHYLHPIRDKRKRKYYNKYIIDLHAEIHCNEKIYISSVLTLCTLSEI